MRLITASRSALNRPEASIRLKLFKLLALLAAGIVIFPPEPTEALLSMASNSSVLLMLIAALVCFPLVALLPDVVAVVPPLVTLLVEVTDVVGASGGSLNGGALLSG